jgi:probable HAF family extracellular repeat protein
MRFFRLAFSLLLSATPTKAATLYQTIDLGDLGGGSTSAAAINNSGQITGISATANGERHAFLYTPGVGMADLGTLPGDASSAGWAINNLGQVTGDSSPSNGFTTRGFLYTPGSGMIDLGTLGGVYTSGDGINDAGQVTGQSTPVGGPCFTPFCKSDPAHAFLYTPGAGMIDLGTLGGNVASGQDINNLGQVAGDSSLAGDTAFHAFLYTPGVGMTDLGTLGANYSHATALNDHSEVVGVSIVTGFVHHAFVYRPVQGMTDLGLDGAIGINESGQVIGERGPLSTGFLYSDGITVDLGSLHPVGINDAGQIVGNNSDRSRAFLLTPIVSPVPEPATTLPLFAALLALGGAIFRRHGAMPRFLCESQTSSKLS